MASLKRFCFVFIISFMLLWIVSAADRFSEALLSLKSELFDDYDSLSDWVLSPVKNPPPSGTVPACSWSGVVCNGNGTAVVGLDLSARTLGGVLSGKQFDRLPDLVDLNLSENAFSGELPRRIFNLTDLKSFDISRNNFSGEFPAGISRLRQLARLNALSNGFSGGLPAEISELDRLRFLNLAGSYFTGPIPPEYGSFRSLEFLLISGNFLTGRIPPELGKLRTVVHMELGYNNYQGGIPWQLGNMSELQYLDIANANISGEIPSHLSNLTKLESLFLFGNAFTGPIPWEFSRIKTLKNMDLSENLISGSIPESFSEMKNLRLLSVMANEMNGSVPEGIAELPNLETLFVWHNHFTGPLPKSLGLHSKLESVDVSSNGLVGGIPPGICAGGRLLKLILFSNKFSGSLSPSLSNCSSLVRLRLEDNGFSGDIPLNFGLLPNITYVDLSRNRFTGGIPMDLPKASQLQVFNVSRNLGLGGAVPEETFSLPLLQNFSVSSCNLSGYLPQFHGCESVSVIELEMNRLSGAVPENISRCVALEKLDLSGNRLTGRIPLELSDLPNLAVLDLSRNSISGPIPRELGSSPSLLRLNLSFNNISGSIPSQGVFRLMGGSSFVGNSLCGPPLQACSDGWRSRGAGRLTLALLLCAGAVVLISLSVSGALYFKKRNKGHWKMVSFIGLPQFTANDVLRSFDPVESMAAGAAPFKAGLPTGITVCVKKLEWEAGRMRAMLELMTRMGNVRHKNLVRLLGFCYNREVAYLLYDYLPCGSLLESISEKRDWAEKCRIVIAIARGLCHLHHDCCPAIPHGDLRSCNVLFDDNSEPRLADFGIKFLVESRRASFPATFFRIDSGELSGSMDVYRFGELILEILTNGRVTNGGEVIHGKARGDLLRELYIENGTGSVDSSGSLQEEIKQVLELALICTRSRPSDRPSMEDALKVLSGLRPRKK